METGEKKWGLQTKNGQTTPITVRSVRDALMDNLNKEDDRAVIHLCHGDPSYFPSFSTSSAAVNSLVQAINSGKHNGYAPAAGLFSARRAVAEHLNQDLPHKLYPENVFITVGCSQAIEITLKVLGGPQANILLPRPGYPYYEAVAADNHLEVRHFDLLPDKRWEIDLEAVESLADENTVALIIINPGNPCGNVYSYEHLKKVAETARKLGIMVVADEVYGHLAFGNTPFVPMGVFGSIAPVLSLGSISKRWIVPGWRIGWLVVNDPNGVLEKYGIINSIVNCLNIYADPTTFVQAALPQILENTNNNFFSKIINVLREVGDICCDKIQDISCITLPTRPEGSMSVMTKLNLSLLKGIKDDTDFCLKLAKEESVIVIPGICVGMKNWLCITFAVEPSTLEVGLARIKTFCERHAK